MQQVHERSSVLVFIYKYMAPRFLALAGHRTLDRIKPRRARVRHRVDACFLVTPLFSQRAELEY